MLDIAYEAPIEISTSATPSASVIWLHGLGADGNDFVPVVKVLNLPHVRFILPHAAFKKVTANNGYEMRAWYDIFSFTPGSKQDEAGVRESQTYIESLVAKEVARGIPASRIVIAGFSQGGAIALQTALRQEQALAGVLALSTYLPLHTSFEKEKTKANQNTPIFMAHGTFDTIIPLSTYRASYEFLQVQHYTIERHEYAMAHSVNQQEIDDIRAFLLRVLGD
jgi:phospholipase/carboxylesterase